MLAKGGQQKVIFPKPMQSHVTYEFQFYNWEHRMRIEAFLNSHGDEIEWWAMTNPMNVQNPIDLLGFDLFDPANKELLQAAIGRGCDPKGDQGGEYKGPWDDEE